MKSTQASFYKYVGQTSPASQAFQVVSGRGAYLYDADGVPHIDLISGISVSVLGHGHPAIVKAIQEQSERYLHSMVYGEHIQRPQVALAEALVEALPPSIERCHFVSTGAEAIECAVKMAKRATRRYEVVSLSGGYHGNTHMAMSLNNAPYYNQAYRPLVPGVRHIDPVTADLSLITERTACAVFEVIQGAMGYRVLEVDLIKQIRHRCDEVGALMIIDEIQTGLGRTGLLWGHERAGIVPDAICLAKALGGGLPLGAVLASDALLEVLTHDPVLGHISTFGGHPLSCAAGLAAWHALQDEIHLDDVQKKEELVRAHLQHPLIREITGRGLLLAVHVDPKINVLELCKQFEQARVLTGGFLYEAHAFRVAPPLNVTEEELVDALGKVLRVLDAE